MSAIHGRPGAFLGGVLLAAMMGACLVDEPTSPQPPGLGAPSYTCGLISGGDGYCWGLNAFGQLGVGIIPSFSDIPLLVSGGHAFQTIGAGFRHGCGVTPAGVAWCWGDNTAGQLGDGNGPISTTTPVEVAFP